MDAIAVGGLIVGALGVVVAVYYGQKTLRGQSKRHQVKVTVSDGFPVFSHPDGSQDLDDHYVMVEAVNLGNHPIAITGWGIKLPGDKRLIQTRRIDWTTPLPHVLRPGEPPARFAMLAEGIREVNRERGVPYRKMRPYVQLADGRELYANKSVLLA